MLNREIFVFKEAYRNIILNKNSSLIFFGLLTLNLFLLAGIFIFFVNTNYFFEILSLPRSNTVDPLLLFQIFIGCSLGFCLYYINQIFFQRYLLFYLDEIKLMTRLDCPAYLRKRPLLYSAYLINASAIITVLCLVSLLYNNLFQLLEKKFFFLLQFTMFDTTLIIVLVLSSLGAIIAASNYLFWQNKIC